MPRVLPFAGLRFDLARVGSLERVTAPPYDVISPEEHDRFLAVSPHNVIRLDLGEESGGPGESDRYAIAAAGLRTWRSDGILVGTGVEAYYPYEMAFSLGGRRRRIRGAICAVELEDWGGSIVPHERTMPGPVEDRLRLMRALEANLSCIYAVFQGPSDGFAAWLEEAMTREPAGSLMDEDGVEHRLWVAPAEPEVERWLGTESFMIADGHHRYATALRYRDEMRAERGAGPWDATMMFVVDSAVESPPVLPYHRIQGTGGVPTDGIRVRDLQEVLGSVDDRVPSYGIATHEAGVLTHRVSTLVGEAPAVCRLHEQPLDGIDGSLRFTPDAVAAEEEVRRGEAVAAYFLPATDAATIRSVLDRGQRLPQKSTFFWPKPRTGMIIRPHEA